jgi:hypothetical protein
MQPLYECWLRTLPSLLTETKTGLIILKSLSSRLILAWSRHARIGLAYLRKHLKSLLECEACCDVTW